MCRPTRVRRSRRGRVLRSSPAQIKRETAAQFVHVVVDIISKIIASVLRALAYCGALVARPVNLRERLTRDLALPS
jgi:hypothetical protein